MMALPDPYRLFETHTLATTTLCTLSNTDKLDPHLIAFSEMLDTDETGRAKALLREEDQARFIASHGLLRTLLATETGQDADALEFTRNAHGKPQLVMPGAPHFSLSTSQNLAAVAINRAQAVGIDVECTQAIDVPLMLPMVGHKADQYILELPETERLKAFYRLWTGKEAILKAIGKGFQEDPREIELGERFLSGTTHRSQVAVFDQCFDLVCEETPTAMVSLALSSQPT